jgi:hypothetical protein
MKPLYVTSGVTQDGFGARMQRILSVLCYTYHLREELRLPVVYVHTPFSYQGPPPIGEDYVEGVDLRGNFDLANPYPYDDISHRGYFKRAELWDQAFVYSGETVNSLDISSFEFREGYDLFNLFQKNTYDANILFILRYLHKEYDLGILDINNFKKYRNKILSSFGLSKGNYSKKKVAIHIRRKDAINHVHKHFNDEYYLEILNILGQYKEKYDITIYTQRVGFDPEPYKGWEIVYDDTEEDYNTFKKMVFADHLIVGGSSFSYAAALLNPNTVVYHFAPSAHHKAIDTWIDKNDYIQLLNTKH